MLVMREEAGGVDPSSFYSWALKFVDLVQNLTANSWHVLLIYNSYGAHMALRVLELFKRYREVAYALPVHTSGPTLPLDVVPFAVFKHELKIAMSKLGYTAHLIQA